MLNYNDYFSGLTSEEYEEQTKEHFEWLDNNVRNRNTIKEWYFLTNDENSYPETFEYVLVEDDIGDKNIAYCDPDYNWHISNGENSLKLIGEVIKWAYVD